MTAVWANQLSLLPSEYFQRQVTISTLYHRDDVPQRCQIGVDRILWGSDFPHHEGTAGYTPGGCARRCAICPNLKSGPFFRKTTLRFATLDVDLLQKKADRIRPTVQQIATPPAPQDIPKDPNFVLAFPDLLDVVSAH